MDWTMLGALGELGGAAAVVASLVYVGRQLKHTAQSTAVEGVEQFMSKIADWSLQISGDPGLADLTMRVQVEGGRRDDFTRGERGRIGYLFYGVLVIQSAMFERWRQGLMTREMFEQYASHHAGLMAAPYLVDLWPILRGNFNPDYADFVEERFELIRALPDPGTG